MRHSHRQVSDLGATSVGYDLAVTTRRNAPLPVTNWGTGRFTSDVDVEFEAKFEAMLEITRAIVRYGGPGAVQGQIPGAGGEQP